MNYNENKIITLLDLYQVVGHHVDSVDNLSLCIQVLDKHNRATNKIHNGTLFIKLAKPGDKFPPVITESDLGKLVNAMLVLS